MNRIKIHEDFDLTPQPNGPAVIDKVTEGKTDGGKRTITTIVEGIHAGMTRNYTFYPGTGLADAAESWTSPYAKPVLKNHDDWMGEPLGRVKSATFTTSQIDPSRECIKLTLEIADPDAIEKVLDGRYRTLSIGASAGSAKCSICGKDIIKEGFCGHWKGQKYDGKEAYWIIGEMEFDEISFVNVPADRHAQVLVPDAKTQKSSAEGRSNGMEDNTPTADKQAEEIIKQVESLMAQGQEEPDKDPEQTQESTEGQPADPTQTQEGTEDPAGTEDPEKTQESTEVDESAKIISDLQEALATEQATTQELRQTLEAAQATNRDLTTQLEQANAQIQTLTTQIEELQQQIVGAQEESKKMLKQNIDIATYAHRMMAERVFDLQVVLGEAKDEDRVEAVKQLASHKASELKVQLEGLVAKRPARVPQQVANPGLKSTGVGDAEETTESASSQPPTIADLEKVVMTALRGKKA